MSNLQNNSENVIEDIILNTNDKEAQSRKRKDYIEPAVFCLILLGTFLTSFYNYLLFHTIAELFSIIIAGGIFVIAWNSRKNIDNSYFLVVGIAFIFIGFIDLIHTLGYTGMGIFIGYDSNLPTSLWIAARYLQAFSYLYAILVVNKKVNPNYLMIIYTIITSLLLFLIFNGFFPVCYIEGSGLTPFKIISEYIIISILFLTICIMYKFRKEFNKKIFIFIVASIVLTMISELAFTFYVSTYGLSNLIGHMFKIIAFFLLYKAIIEIGLEKPFNLLFRKLKQSESSLLEEKEFTETALNSQRDTFFIFDPSTGKAIRWNKAFSQVSGYSDEEISSIPAPISYYNEYDLKKAAVAIENVKKEGKTVVEMNLITKNGKTIPFEYVGTSINDEEGNPKYILSIGRDITERQKAEQKLEESEERFRSLVETTSDWIWEVDENGVYIYSSPKVMDLLGYAPKEVIGKTPFNLMPLDEAERVGRIFQSIILSQEPFEGLENTNQHKEGRIITLESSGVPVFGKNGNLRGYRGIDRDITKRKKAEQKLEEFVSTVSHELRTPITVLIMSIDYLKNQKDKLTPEVEAKLLEGISRNITSLNELVEDVLTLSKIDEEKLKMEWKEFYPLEVIHEIIDLMEPRLKAKEINIEVDMHEGIQIFGSKNIIEEIFKILIDNAIKYSHENSRIEIKAIDNYKYIIDSKEILGVLFQFKDYGIGIRKEDIPYLFKRFFRSEDVKNISGSGLGLSIAKELTKFHDGKIFVESEYGKGSTFSVFFHSNKNKE